MLLASTEGWVAITRCCTETWLTAARSFSVSYGRLCRRLGLMTCAVTTMPSVWPSPADFATRSVPTTVPAPGRFSTITDWPQTACILPATRRPMMSVAPPGGNGTINRTGFVGKPRDAVEKINNENASSLSIDARNPARGHGVVGIEFPEVVGGAPAGLRRHAVALEKVELRRHVAEPGCVEPQPHQP